MKPSTPNPPPRHGRRRPYTAIGIRRLPCCRCGERAEQQWQACADDSLWRPMCIRCDVELNRLALEFMRDPQAEEKIALYAGKLLGEISP